MKDQKCYKSQFQHFSVNLIKDLHRVSELRRRKIGNHGREVTSVNRKHCFIQINIKLNPQKTKRNNGKTTSKVGSVKETQHAMKRRNVRTVDECESNRKHYSTHTIDNASNTTLFWVV